MPAPRHDSVVPVGVTCEPTLAAGHPECPLKCPMIRAVRYPVRGRVAATLPDNNAASSGPAVSPPRHDEGPATAHHVARPSDELRHQLAPVSVSLAVDRTLPGIPVNLRDDIRRNGVA